MKHPITLQLSRRAAVLSPAGQATPLASLDAALLAWLALEGPTPRERLAGLLWPQADAASASNSLRQRLFRLRRQWGDALVSGQATLALAAGVRLDLAQADTLLADLAAPDSEAFSHWLQAQREALAARAEQALVTEADAAEAARAFDTALAAAQQLLQRAPLSEAAHRRVIRLHYLRGDRAAALLAFDHCEQVLKDEVGVPPSDDTLALLQAVEQQHTGPALQPAAAVPAVVLRPPRLVGRQAEEDHLRRTLAAQGVVLLMGDAGMGKSRLIEALLEPGAGPPALAVAARPGDDLAPFSLLARWLRQLLHTAALQPTALQRQDLARVLPEFGPAPARSSDAERALQLVALESLLRDALVQQPAVMLLDDLHYADAPSVQLLHSLLGSSAGAGCGWLLALRPGEMGPAMQALVDQHGGTARVSTVHLQALARGDVESLLGSLALPGWGGPEQAEALHSRTGGNPLYLLETLKAALLAAPLLASQPAARALAVRGGAAVAAPLWPQADNVLRLIQQRLSRLSPLALKVTRCAAVAGQDLTSSLAAQVLGLRPLDLADAWAELEAAQVLRQTSFTHDLIGEAARALVPEAIAQPLHGDVAAALEQSGGDPARIAEHWTAAGAARKAVPHLLQAAVRASAAHQSDESLQLHWRAAKTLQMAGERRAAFDAYLDAAQVLTASAAPADPRVLALVDLLDSLADDVGQFALVNLVRLVVLHGTNKLHDALELGQHVLAQAEQAGAVDVQVEALWSLTAICWQRRDLRAALGWARSALQRLQRVDFAASRLDMALTGMKLHHAMGVMLVATGQYAEGEASLEEVLSQARMARALDRCTNVALSLSVSSMERGDLSRAQHWARQALDDDCRKGSSPQTRQLTLVHAVHISAVSVDLGQALHHAQEVQAISERHDRLGGVFALRRVQQLHGDLGRRDLALKSVRACQQWPDLSAVDKTTLDAMLAHLGEPVDVAPLVDAISAVEDFALRVRLLCLAAPACPPEQLLPLLGVSASTARDLGAMGLWLGLQTRRTAALRALGRQAEAADAALQLWQHLDQGLVGVDLFPTSAAQVCLSLAPVQPALADTIRLRVSAWMHRAAATLPPAWCDNYLARAPALQLLMQAPASLQRLPSD